MAREGGSNQKREKKTFWTTVGGCPIQDWDMEGNLAVYRAWKRQIAYFLALRPGKEQLSRTSGVQFEKYNVGQLRQNLDMKMATRKRQNKRSR